MTTLWRKQVFPFGKIPWRDRELDFTPAYLADMMDAFAVGALDFVPLSAHNASGGGFSSDPSLIRGDVRALELVQDGMYAVVAVDAETDALLEAEPGFPAAARIAERCKISGGRVFPVVLAGLYLTRAPVLTGLRSWTREIDNGR